jgi:hypothetical protein
MQTKRAYDLFHFISRCKQKGVRFEQNWWRRFVAYHTTGLNATAMKRKPKFQTTQW